jgi:hypothetical protein
VIVLEKIGRVTRCSAREQLINPGKGPRKCMRMFFCLFLNKKTITQSGKGKETESKEERGRRHELERGRRLESVLERNEKTC